MKSKAQFIKIKSKKIRPATKWKLTFANHSLSQD